MKHREKYQGLYIETCKHLGLLGIALYHLRVYKQVRGHWPNFITPHDLSEHILSNMHKRSFLKYADLADKVKAPYYVKSKGLEHILLKHYGVWDDANDIDINILPDNFILKPNNGSGGHVYCREKSSFDLESAKKYLNEHLKRGCDYYFEPHYRKIQPKILCEELLDLAPGKVLTDYKFTCVRGNIVDIFIAGENSKGERKYATVDLNWKVLNYTKPEYLLEPLPEKPLRLEEMAKYAMILSEDFEFVRVDFYEHEGRAYFSELTFSPWGGLMYSYTDDALKLLGEKFKN